MATSKFSKNMIACYAAFGVSRMPRACAFSSLSIQGSFAEVVKNIDKVRQSLPLKHDVQLVVVSKTKPIESLKQAYDAGARSFGENYIQELCEKAPCMPADVRWHFIGKLQSNKANKLVSEVPNLAVVESVDSLKLAKKLNNACDKEDKTLRIYIQINTSSEESKGGVVSSQPSELASDIVSTCPRLEVAGLMTIGAPGDLSCFEELVSCRESVAEAMGVDASSLALSMGMSGDYQEAIARGSTSVRVGSSIFGARDYTK